MSLIRADNLEQWASSIVGRNKLGELVRKLIHASISLKAIREIRFLSDEANQLAGWDGLLDCDSQIPWVPNKTSVWELGAGGNAREKIRTDFAARLGRVVTRASRRGRSDRRNQRRADPGPLPARELPSGWQQVETTYVAVTLQKLDDLDRLESELKTDSPWNNVKIYDSQTLAEWIAQYPSVQAWLQTQGVGPPSTIQTLEPVWSVWSQETDPAVSANLILAGRESVAQELRMALQTPGGVINVQADSPAEALAFIFAAVDSVKDEFRQHFLDGSIIVSRQDDADRLQHFPPQNVILRPPATEKAVLLTRFGHTIINALGNSAITQKEGYRLQRALTNQFTKALVEMGMTQEQSDIEARACGRSPSVWRVWNLLQQADLCSEIPEWARIEHSDKVVLAILLGAWSENFDGDKEVVEAITGQDFNDFCDQLHPFLSVDHPLLTRAGDAWVVTAPATAFALVVRHITRSQMEKLRDIVLRVFEEKDPTIDLPPDERPYTRLHTGGMRHSKWLRDGLAETLLRIVVIGTNLEATGAIPANQGCQAFVDQLIRQLPGLNEDWRLTASLRAQYPVLVEAAPNPFLESLEHLLQGSVEKLLPIFEEGDSFWGHPLHPALWWALETLAWEPMYLGRVVLILARLAKIDPGGRLENRPINSLRRIFLAWKPGTSASLEQRLQALDLILEREPTVGWSLLLSLMPKSNDFASPTNEPIWKDFSRSKREMLTNDAVRQAYIGYIDRTIKYAGVQASRCKQLLQFYTQVSPPHQAAIENCLRTLAATNLTENDRNSLWNTLRDFINSHRQFESAAWALPADQLERLEGILDLFAPIDLAERVAWLFNESHPDIGMPRGDLQAQDAEREKLRLKAVEEILKTGGIEALISFLDKVSYPGLLSEPMFDLLQSEAALLDIYRRAAQGSPGQRIFTSILSRIAYQQYGDKWTNMVISLANEDNWPADVKASAFIGYPDSKETFELVSNAGPDVEREYWQNKDWIHPTEDRETILLTVEKLMAVGRTLDVIALTPRRLTFLDSEILLKVLDQALKELNEGKVSRLSSGSYWIEELFDLLRGRNDIKLTELARREYAYLPILTRAFEKKTLALHKLLATEPSFFVDMVCDLYKAHSAEQVDESVTEEGRNRAQFAWDLLRSWHYPPGVDETQKVNEAELKEWITKARLLAAERDRKIVADQHIGKVLYHYPRDPSDGAWPHMELRKLLDELQSDDLEKGISMEQFNSRGVVTYELFEGGDKERALANQWKLWADTVGIRWPRTRSMLERIAASWEREATQRDVDAQKERLRST